ncbi:MAG: hypothetical protein PHO62_09740 [Sulfurimonas sp.]|uniref:hypothetical protein n=1 Tax=Sulfurimonas sp. TaxID=2022749 RepID=UPI00261C1905|nr:hypothetical protein [Sulfurimonas sp.]MDD5373690.1 hypothetical protein [Sulfurimonas sp.]
MCNDFKVILKIENLDEESKNLFEQNLKEIIVEIKNILELEINTLDRVILTENYKNELELLKEEGIDESLLTYTDNGLGIGIAKSIDINGKDIVILSETFLSMFSNKDTNKSIFNILAHELAHIDDRNKKNTYIKEFFIEEYANYEDKAFYPLAKNSWNEFYANYKASRLLTQLNINHCHDTFFDALNNFEKNIFDKKWSYQNRLISLSEFLDSFKTHAYYLFNQASYLLGNIIGMNYTLDKYLDEIDSSIKNTIMEETLYTMERIFNNLIQNYPDKWNGIKELENLKICLIDYYKDIGVVFKEVEGQSYVDVKFSKYGHQE